MAGVSRMGPTGQDMADTETYGLIFDVDGVIADTEAVNAAGSKCLAVTNSTIAADIARADPVVDSLADADIATVVQLIERGCN